MVSQEMLKRYPFFGSLTENQLKEIAMISSEVIYEKGEVIFEECEQADSFFLLIDGSVELYYKSEDPNNPKMRKEFYVGDINPGEVFAISALIEPYSLNATGKASQRCRTIKIDALSLRKLLKQDLSMALSIMTQVAKETMERLGAIRVQLAATRSE